MDSTEIVVEALRRLQDPAGGFPAHLFSPSFRIRTCGKIRDLNGVFRTRRQRQDRLQSVTLKITDLFGKGDQVAVVRKGAVQARDGTQAFLTVIDVWRLQDGLIVEADQCWNRVPGPASDDLPLTAREGEHLEAVRGAIACFQDLAGVQGSLRQRWAPEYSGRMNGVAMDLPTLCRHWAALQARLSTVLVEIKELVAHGTAVGAVYHLLLGKKGSASSGRSGSAGGGRGTSGARTGTCIPGTGGIDACSGAIELHIVAVFSVTPCGGRIASCQAVSRLVSGSEGDEELATVLSEE